MPAPVPLPNRLAILDRQERGESTAESAVAFDLAQRAIRGLVRRGRLRGRDAVAADSPRPKTPEPPHPRHAAALQLRERHPTWGAGLIRVMLAREGPEPLPSVRTFQRWFTKAGLGPAPGGRATAGDPAARDLVGRRRRGGPPGRRLQGLLAADRRRVHGRGARHRDFPPSGGGTACRRTGPRRGCARRLPGGGCRGRSGSITSPPWGSAGDLPTDLALWLIGLGVEMIWNPPRRPQDNGVVERSQGTGKRWAEPPTCQDAAELQRRIDELDPIQRALLHPSIGGKSRLEAIPE